MVTEMLARKYNAAPIAIHDGSLVVAVDDPRNFQAVTEKRIDLVLGTGQNIQEPLTGTTGLVGRSKSNSAKFQPRARAEKRERSGGSPPKPSSRRRGPALDLLISRPSVTAPLTSTSSPKTREFRVGFRIDGILHEMMSLLPDVQALLVSRSRSWRGQHSALPHGGAPAARNSHQSGALLETGLTCTSLLPPLTALKSTWRSCKYRESLKRSTPQSSVGLRWEGKEYPCPSGQRCKNNSHTHRLRPEGCYG